MNESQANHDAAYLATFWIALRSVIESPHETMFKLSYSLSNCWSSCSNANSYPKIRKRPMYPHSKKRKQKKNTINRANNMGEELEVNLPLLWMCAFGRFVVRACRYPFCCSHGSPELRYETLPTPNDASYHVWMVV